jgi:uncharacterized membrane protein
LNKEKLGATVTAGGVMPPSTVASGLASTHSHTDEGAAVVDRLGLVTALGRLLFGIPMVVFGIQHFIYVDFVLTLMPVWIPGRRFWTYFTGVALIAGGTGITLGKIGRRAVGQLAATLLGVMIFLFVLLVHVPQVVATPDDPRQLTYLCQALTFSGMALVASATMWGPRSWRPVMMRSLTLGRWFVAIGVLALGARQLLQIPFVLGLVPSWYPGQPVWALVCGVLLIATGIGIILGRERVPAMLLGAVLLLFLLFVHLPSLAANPRGGDWGAACKDSIFCGGVLVLAGARARQR